MHTVAEIGFWGDPKILAFSLKVGNPDAGAWILRLREFILLKGTDDGKLPGYSMEEIWAVIRPTCGIQLLFNALKRFDHLKLRKKTWYSPNWSRSPMGQYCRDRAWSRSHKRQLREAAHQVAMDQVSNEVGGRQDDVRLTSSGKSTVSKTRRQADDPPVPPQRGGVGKALPRWEWVE